MQALATEAEQAAVCTYHLAHPLCFAEQWIPADDKSDTKKIKKIEMISLSTHVLIFHEGARQRANWREGTYFCFAWY